jgi:hypothetical protein
VACYYKDLAVEATFPDHATTKVLKPLKIFFFFFKEARPFKFLEIKAKQLNGKS